MNFKRFCGVALCLVVLCVASAAAFFRADRTDQMTSTIVIGNARIDVVVEKGELKEGSNFYTIKLRLATSFNNLTYVYVVNYLMKNEQQKLEQRSAHD